MKIRFRLSWLIFTIILLGILTSVVSESLRSQRQMTTLKDSISRSEIDVSRSILGTVEEKIGENDWGPILDDFSALQQATRANRIYLTTYDGEIVLDSRSSGPIFPTSLDLIQEAFRLGSSTRWIPSQDTLQVAVRVNTHNLHSASVLVREVPVHTELNEMRLSQSQAMVWTALISIVFGILVMFGVYGLVVRPMARMRAAIHTASHENITERFQSSLVAEVDDFGRTFNQLLERVDTQRSELESLNRSLESTVAEQAREVERVSRDLAARAAGLETINRIINSVSSASNHRDLARIALQQIQSAARADYGWIALNGSTYFISTPSQSQQESAERIDLVQGDYDVHLLVPDWLSPDLPPDLEVFSRSLLKMEIRSTASVSIRAGKKAIGRIDLASLQPGFWNQRDFALFVIIGQQLGVVIERMQDYEASLENSRLMARLAELGGLLNRPLSLDEVVATIGKGILDLTAAPRAAVFERQSDGEIALLWQHNLPRRLSRSLVARTKADRSFFLPVNPVGYQVADVAGLPDDKAEWWKIAGAGIRAYTSWPLAFEGQTSPVVVAFYDRPATYTHLQMEVLDAFSRQAAIALRNARLLDSEREQRILAEGLRDVAAALTSTLDLNEVTERILTNINRVVEHDAANVMLLEGDNLHIVRSRGQPLVGLQVSEWRHPLSLFKILEQVARTGRAVAIPDTDIEPLWVQRPESSWIKSYATAPIRSRGRVIGFVNVSSKAPGFFTQAHASLLQAFADQASIALDNASLFQSTRAVATETNTLLRALAPLFAAGGDLATVADEIARAVVAEFSQSHCGVMMVDKERNCVDVFREFGEIQLGVRSLPLNGPGLTVAAVRSLEIIYSPDVSKDKRYVSGSHLIRSELVIPLVAGGDVIGALNLESPNLDAFDEDSRRMLSAFAERAAWVLANAQLFDNTRAGARQMTLLNEITQVALSGGDIQVILREVVRRVADLINADGCYMTRWEEATQQTIPLMAYGINQETYTSEIPEPGEKNLTYALMREGRPIPIEDTYSSAYLPRYIAELFPTRSLLGVPLQVNGQKLGAILVGFNRPYQFTAREILVVQQAGGQIALILARMNALVEAQARAEESERLRRASAALTTTLDVQAVARLIIEHMSSLVQYHTAIVYQYQKDGLTAIAYHNIPSGEELLEMKFPLDDPLLVDVVRSDGALTLNDAQADPRYKNWGGTENIHSWMGLPLKAGNEVVGSINLGRLEVKPFDANEILLAQVFANQAGVALQNALLHAHQQQLAITDPLTGLYNRRGFFELARHELERSRRFNRPLALMMLDIDHFKAVNDLHGHAAGDDVLRELGRRFRNVMREADLICRYGGEEFCFLLPESDREGLCSAAERLLLEVRSRPFLSGETNIFITVSIGVTALVGGGASLEDLIAQADLALYQAKQAGRDRTELFISSSSPEDR